MKRSTLFAVVLLLGGFGESKAGEIFWPLTGQSYPTPSGPFFVAPYDATLYLQEVGGAAGATTEFGIGTSIQNHTAYFIGLPNNPNPTTEVEVGYVAAGTSLNFYEKTEFLGSTYWAFSNQYATDLASFIAFWDPTLSFSSTGSIVQQTSPTTWVLHLDDAASYLVDDNNADVLIQVRLVPVPEPSTLSMFMISIILGPIGYAWRGRKQVA
jgi:PEP-CTERM motif